MSAPHEHAESLSEATGIEVGPTSAAAASSRATIPTSLDRAVFELIELEKHFPPPDQRAIVADCQWLQDHWGKPVLTAYRGTHVAILNGEVVGHADDSIRLEIDLARKFNVHPQRLVIEYIDPPLRETVWPRFTPEVFEQPWVVVSEGINPLMPMAGARHARAETRSDSHAR